MGKANDTRHRRRKPAPIRAHPAFAILVALWFAALFGLGSLFFPVQPLERLIGVSPAAASPLAGLAIKLAVAGLAGLAGYALGLLIARKVAQGPARSAAEGPQAQSAPTMRDIQAEGPRQPIIAHEELGEGFGPVPEDAPEDDGAAADFAPPPRYDSPWLADEDGHVWSEELADAPLLLSEPEALSHQDMPPHGTVAVAPDAGADTVEGPPLSELGMVELIDRLAQAIQQKQGLARSLPDNAGEMVRRLDAEVQASNAAYASLMDINSLKPAATKPPVVPPSEAAATFPDASFRSPSPQNAGLAIAQPDRETDALRSALETLRRMSGTA